MGLNKQLAGLIGAGLLLIAGSAHALQFEKPKVESNLNDPLKARFTIGHLTPAQRKTLKIRKAPKRDYQRFNFKRDLAVGRIKLTTTGTNSSAPVVVHLTTEQPITSTVVSFLAEATTQNGKYFHRYDLLINPKQPSKKKNSSSASKPGGSSQASSVPSESTHSSQNSGGGHQSGQVKARRNKQYPGPGKPRKHKNYGPVKKGETLWDIAKKLKPSGATTPQMAVALYRATPKAFNGGINKLETGVYLTVPYAKNVRAINNANAKHELESGS